MRHPDSRGAVARSSPLSRIHRSVPQRQPSASPWRLSFRQMIKRPTVLIIGAGAGAPFGFEPRDIFAGHEGHAILEVVRERRAG